MNIEPGALQAAAALVMGLLGGGGVVAWRKQRHDERLGVRQQEAAEGAADDARWVALIEQQTIHLLAPLTKKVEQQDVRIGELEREVRSTRRLYRRTLDLLLAYVRHVALLAGLLNDHSIPHPPPPAIPADIHDDM